jgi:hypothetical protein
MNSTKGKRKRLLPAVCERAESIVGGVGGEGNGLIAFLLLNDSRIAGRGAA